MQTPREQIYLALYTLLQGITDWNFVDRQFHVITEISEGQFPAMMMCQSKEKAEVTGRGIPIRWRLLVEVVIYVDTTNDLESIPASLINPLIDAVELAIQPDVGNQSNLPQTLGGLVSQCRINGEIETDEGKLGARGWVVIPVEITVPA
jgi:hypothetical protein